MITVPAEHLLLIVASLIVANRAFDSTGLRLSRAAYVTVQALNLVAVVGIFISRLDIVSPKLDFAVRTFLMLFVGWHMVRNNESRRLALRAQLEEQRSREERIAAAEAPSTGNSPGSEQEAGP